MLGDGWPADGEFRRQGTYRARPLGDALEQGAACRVRKGGEDSIVHNQKVSIYLP